jgi:glycosyltransferase involved in cell wall biosynthesis
MERFGISSQKLKLIPIGVHPKKRDPGLKEILRKSYGYQSSRLILYVGTIFQRRHLPVLIRALRELEPDVKLALVGENRSHPLIDLHQIARDCGVESRLILLEYASPRILEDYYRMADVFVYLSTYEGFGIPPLEAMSYGIPTIVSRTPAMDEIYQYSAMFVPEIKAVPLAECIRSVLRDEPLREQLIARGLAQVERSHWENSAQMMARDWEQLLAARS